MTKLLPINSQKPCKDAISRREVLDVIDRELFKWDVIDEVRKLPPVNPQKPICPSAGVDCEDCSAYEKKLNKWIGAEVLDMIRAEIEGWQVDIHDNEYDANEHDFVFERIFEIIDKFIDKYKAESEGKNV